MKEKHIKKTLKFSFVGLLIFYEFYQFLIIFFIFIKMIDNLNKFLSCSPLKIYLGETITIKPKDNLPIYVSIATTPSRIKNFITHSLPNFEKYKHINLIINVCKKYKRFNDTIDENLLHQIDNFKNIHIHWTDDLGPITKLVGGKIFMEKYNLNGHFLVADDDDYYSEIHFHRLINLFNKVSLKKKTTDILVTGSVFTIEKCKLKKYNNTASLIDNINCMNLEKYIPYIKHFNKLYEFTKTNIVNNQIYKCYNNNLNLNFLLEGFKGILFNNKLLKNTNLDNFTKYYKTIDYCKKNNLIINNFLLNCFLADDFVISYFYKDYHFIKYTAPEDKYSPKSHFSYDYGFQDDALHNTYSNCNDGNIKRYYFLKQNISIFNVFTNKINLNEEIIKKVII